MKQSTLNNLKIAQLSGNLSGESLGYVMGDETIPEESKRQIEEATRAGHPHESIIQEILKSPMQVTPDEPARSDEEIKKTVAPQQTMGAAGDALTNAALTAVPMMAGMGGVTMGIASRFPKLAGMAPEVLSALDYVLGSSVGRAATGQNPVGVEALSEIPAVMGGPVTAQVGAGVSGKLGAALRTILAGAGGAGGVNVAHSIQAGKPETAGVISTVLGGLAGAGGQAIDEVSKVLKPTTQAKDALATLETEYPNIKGKLSSALFEKPDSARLSTLETLGADPFVVNPAVAGMEKNMGEELFKQTSMKAPLPRPDVLEQIAKQVENGRVSQTVLASKDFRDRLRPLFNQKREAISQQYGAVADALKGDVTPLNPDEIVTGVVDLQNKFSGLVAKPPSSPVADKILALTSGNPPSISVAQISQMIHDLKPTGDRISTKFNEEVRDLLMGFIQKNKKKVAPATQTAIDSFPGVRADYRKYAGHRDQIEGDLFKSIAEPEATFGKKLIEPPKESEAFRETLKYFNADPEFQKVSAQLNASQNIPKILDRGFSSAEDLTASAIDIANPDRAERAWMTLKKVVQDPKDLEIIGSKVHDKMLYPSINRETGQPELNLYAFLTKFNSMPTNMAKNVYGTNYPNVKKFVDLVEPAANNMRDLKATPQGMASSARLRSSLSSYMNVWFTKPIYQVAGLGTMGAIGQLPLGAAMLVGPSMLGKMVLHAPDKAFNLLQSLGRMAAAKAEKAGSITESPYGK